MRVKIVVAAIAAACTVPALAQQAKPAATKEDPFTYQCTGSSRSLPDGLALGKFDREFKVRPGTKDVVLENGKAIEAQIDEYRISFPLEENHWISITRSNGKFNVVKPIKNPDRKMQEYLHYFGECKRV